MPKTKPEPLGTIWPYRANIYDLHFHLVGTCVDTPNAIAKALMELEGKTDGVYEVCDSLGKFSRIDAYKSRMQSWNTCPSGLIRY